MARVTYQASAQNKPWDPNITPDTTDRILKQSQDYIEKLKNARDFQAQQDVQFITEYTRQLEKGVDSQRKVDDEQERQTRALATYKQGLLRDQANRAKTIGGSVNGSASQTEGWFKFITEASATAAKAFGDIKEIQKETDTKIATEIYAMLGVDQVKIGADFKHASARIFGENQNALATIAEQRGQPELAARLRKMNSGQKAELDRLRAIGIGRSFGSAFQRDVYASESVMDVMIDGEVRPINTLRTAEEFDQARPQYRHQYFQSAGIDPTNSTSVDGLIASQKSWETMIATTRQAELTADKNNLLDEAETAFTIKAQDPDTAQAAVMDLFQAHYHMSGGDYKTARAAVMKQFENPGQTSDAAFTAFQQTVLPGQTKSIGELYADEVREVRQKRISESSEVQRETDVQQQTQSKAEAQRVYKARIADLDEDGDVDLSPESVRKQIEKYTRLGPNWAEARKAWEALIPDLSSTQRDEALQDQFQQLSDRGALSEDFVMRSDGSEELKRKWLKSINATAEQTVSDEDLTEFTDIARAVLMDRTNETPGASGKSNNANTKRALRKAVDDYRKDYVAALRDGQTATQASKYAEDRFNARFADTTGMYRVNEVSDIENGKEVKIGVYTNFGPDYQAEIEEPFVNLNQKIEELGSAVVDTEGVIPKPVLERVSKKLLQNNRIMIPPAIVALADSTGGKLSVLDVLNRQLAASGLEQVPPDVFGVAKEAEDSIAPEWQQRLNYKPNVIRTDTAMIGSGQEPIYMQVTPSQERVKAIFSSRESPQAGYDAINAGNGGDRPGGATRHLGKPLTQMTLGEVKQYQNLPTGDPKGIFAVGKYQFIPETLAIAAEEAGITDDMLFNEAVQDRIFFVHLDTRGAHQPWEKWWIQQGGSHLALTAEEKQVIAAFRQSYDPSKPWRQARNLNPAVIPAIPQEEEPAQAPELTGYFTYDKDGNKIPAD